MNELVFADLKIASDNLKQKHAKFRSWLATRPEREAKREMKHRKVRRKFSPRIAEEVLGTWLQDLLDKYRQIAKKAMLKHLDKCEAIRVEMKLALEREGIEPSEEFQLIKTVSKNSFKSQSGSSEKYARGLAELTAEETRRIGIKAYVEREGNQYHVLFHVMAATSEPDKLREFPADTMTLDETCSFLRNLGIAPKVIFPAM